MAAVVLAAVIHRTARKLAHEGETPYITRNRERWRHELGNYYITDERNVVTC